MVGSGVAMAGVVVVGEPVTVEGVEAEAATEEVELAETAEGAKKAEKRRINKGRPRMVIVLVKWSVLIYAMLI